MTSRRRDPKHTIDHVKVKSIEFLGDYRRSPLPACLKIMTALILAFKNKSSVIEF